MFGTSKRLAKIEERLMKIEQRLAALCQNAERTQNEWRATREQIESRLEEIRLGVKHSWKKPGLDVS